MTRPTALVLSFSVLDRDPRVDRQLRWLARDYRVVAAGLGPPRNNGAEFVRVEWPEAAAPFRLLRNLPRRAMRMALLSSAPLMPRPQRASSYERVYWGNTLIQDCLSKLGPLQPDLVIANDFDTLPLAIEVSRGAPVVFDAHEYAPCEFEDSLAFRLFQEPYRRAICERYIPRARGLTTVCNGIADAFEADTGLRPVVITNAASRESLSPHCAAPGAPIRMVHHGIGSPVRRIETMIDLMDHLENRYELDLMLVPSHPRYVRHLQKRAAGNPRIRFKPVVPMEDIVRATHEYDLGLFLLPPANFNYLHALPNKFFEFVQARLGIAIGPSPEMATLVRRYDLGVIARDFAPASLARALNGLDRRDIDRFKRNANAAAAELCAERNADVFLAVVARATA